MLATPTLPSSSASAEIRRLACDAAFSAPLITNSFRGLVAEAVVSNALGDEWKWCSADYAAWDFERTDGLRLEVKQSAAKQTWHTPAERGAVCSFDIRARQGRYEGATWFDEPGRNAHIYVFAHHPIVDESADHCDPAQWRFYVVPTTKLPASKRIGLSSLARLASDCSVFELATNVELLAAQLSEAISLDESSEGVPS